MTSETPRVEKIFVAWDFTTTGGLKTTLEALAWNSDPIYSFDVPGLRARSGEILRDVVLEGIRRSDRVLVIVDRPNANVGFEAGFALGFGKPICLVHYGQKKPDWLAEPPFSNTLVSAVRGTTQIEQCVGDSSLWLQSPAPAAAGFSVKQTLFLCPKAYEGDACGRVQRKLRPDWSRLPSGRFSFRDLDRICGNSDSLVWTIAGYGENADLRDGRENAANAVVAGWFFARLLWRSLGTSFMVTEDAWGHARRGIWRHTKTLLFAVASSCALKSTEQLSVSRLSNVFAIPCRRLPHDSYPFRYPACTDPRTW